MTLRHGHLRVGRPCFWLPLPRRAYWLLVVTSWWAVTVLSSAAIQRVSARTTGDAMSELSVAHLTSEETVRVTADFWPQPLGERLSLPLFSLAPLSAGSAFLPELEGLPSGSYSVVLEAQPEPLGAIARTEWPRSGGLTIVNGPRVSAGTVVVPFVAHGWHGLTSYLTVMAAAQAPSDSVVNVAIELVDHATHQVAAAARLTIDPAGNPITVAVGKDGPLAVPEGFLGWALLRADRPLAAQVILDHTGSANGVAGLEASPLDANGDALYAPLIFVDRRFATGLATESWRNTKLILVNPDLSPAEVTIHYRGRVGGCAGNEYLQQLTLGGQEQYVIGETAPPDVEATVLPADCGAAARVEVLRGTVVGAALDVVQDKTGGQVLLGAQPLQSGVDVGRRLIVPVVRRNEAGWSSAIYAMNTARLPAQAAIQIFRADGEPYRNCGQACQAVLAPGEAALWSFASLRSLRAGYRGYALIESNRPLAVTVAEEPESRSGLDLALFTALVSASPSPEASPGAREGLAQSPLGRPYVPLVFNVSPLVPRYVVPTATPLDTATPESTAEPTATATTAGFHWPAAYLPAVTR